MVAILRKKKRTGRNFVMEESWQTVKKTLIEALQETSTFTDMRIYLYKSATIAWWRDFSEICDQFPMALGLWHRWHRRDTSKTARAWKPAVRR